MFSPAAQPAKKKASYEAFFIIHQKPKSFIEDAKLIFKLILHLPIINQILAALKIRTTDKEITIAGNKLLRFNQVRTKVEGL